jgi:addiction module HigA family antidote
MKNPPHPGRSLKDDIDSLALTVAEAAEALGATRQQLNNVISGRSGITAEMALRLEKGIGGTADAWLGMQAAYDLSQLRQEGAGIRARKLARRVAWGSTR